MRTSRARPAPSFPPPPPLCGRDFMGRAVGAAPKPCPLGRCAPPAFVASGPRRFVCGGSCRPLPPLAGARNWRSLPRSLVPRSLAPSLLALGGFALRSSPVSSRSSLGLRFSSSCWLAALRFSGSLLLWCFWFFLRLAYGSPARSLRSLATPTGGRLPSSVARPAACALPFAWLRFTRPSVPRAPYRSRGRAVAPTGAIIYRLPRGTSATQYSLTHLVGGVAWPPTKAPRPRLARATARGSFLLLT